jgi:hypothetical protein
MTESRKSERWTDGQRRQRVLESLWLTYYNDVLYAEGLISEKERNRMRLRIRARADGRAR